VKIRFVFNLFPAHASFSGRVVACGMDFFYSPICGSEVGRGNGSLLGLTMIDGCWLEKLCTVYWHRESPH